ncbi:hypothetical protein PACTADRAFT_185557 [Pachysolen tannophilus NRRL Y-2460]|uniref:UBX domain-containing protein n=1 Tax=Pachysolen tannophilus NRRL Y-2460 TaxID=669874 RepID=A0A1E4U236_PACTA|nr:hypothetical protein PACTADRAFT_185557 [Pachysolen tannophilus NRRL Y-2460]
MSSTGVGNNNDTSSGGGGNDDDDLFMTSVNGAIQLSLAQDKPLLIFLTNQTSKQSKDFYLKFISNNKKQLLSFRNSIIFLKLIESTREFGFFKEIFTKLIIPSVYIIKNGSILDIISDFKLTIQDFNKKIEKIISNNNNNNGLSSNSNSKASSSKKSHTKKYSSLKEESAETAAKIYRENLAKQQRLEKEEKARILKLLEFDKEERRKKRAAERRFSSNSMDESSPVREEFHRDSTESPSSPSAAAASTAAGEPVFPRENLHGNTHDNDAEYLIQLKLFNGHSLKQNFPSNVTLSQIRAFINENYPEYQQTPYHFFMPIYRINYSDNDELNKSLKELKLNRAVLIIKPSDHFSTSSHQGYQADPNDLSNQQSSLGWISSSFGGLIGGIFGRGKAGPHNQRITNLNANNNNNNNNNDNDNNDNLNIDEIVAAASGGNNSNSNSNSHSGRSDSLASSIVTNHGTNDITFDPYENGNNIVSDQSQYSTPTNRRSRESTRASTPRPTLNLTSSTNNFSLTNSSQVNIGDPHPLEQNDNGEDDSKDFRKFHTDKDES